MRRRKKSSAHMCVGMRYTRVKIQGFRHGGLKRMYDRACSSRVAPDLVTRVAAVLADLDDACNAFDLDLPGYRLHSLKGDLSGHWSISVSGNWRISFHFKDGDAYDVDLIDYHSKESETWR